MAGRWPGTGRAIGPTGNAGRHRNGPISPVNDPGTGQLSRSFQGASRVRVYADRVSRWGTNFTTAARSRWVGPVLRVLVAGVFLYTGWAKIQDIDDTIRSVRNYQLLPEAVVPTVGSALPVVELILGAAARRSAHPVHRGADRAGEPGVLRRGGLGLGARSADRVRLLRQQRVTSNRRPATCGTAAQRAIMLACAALVRLGPGRFALDEKLGLSPTAEPDRGPDGEPDGPGDDFDDEDTAAETVPGRENRHQQ